MNCLLLAAGLGTRLRPLTESVPKCLMPINGKPLLEIWIEKLFNSKVNEVLINTHYLHKEVETFINNNKYKNKITLIYEKKLLGTAGTIIKNKQFFKNNDGIIIHADNFFNGDLDSLIQAHNKRPKKCVATMLAFTSPSPKECGIIKIDKQNVMIDFMEKPKSPGGKLANGAIYIFENSFLNNIHNIKPIPTDLSIDVLPKLKGKVFVYKTNKLLVDIGTIERYQKIKNYKL